MATTRLIEHVHPGTGLIMKDTVMYRETNAETGEEVMIMKAAQFTCFECHSNNINMDCQYKFDPYNAFGDCLAMK